MEHKKTIKKIGFIFGLKREMNLVLHKNNNVVCAYGYGKGSKNATQELIELGVDIVINFGFAGQFVPVPPPNIAPLNKRTRKNTLVSWAV